MELNSPPVKINKRRNVNSTKIEMEKKKNIIVTQLNNLNMLINLKDNKILFL